MIRIGMFKHLGAAILLGCFAADACAQDTLKIAVGQRGGWEQCVSELGQNAGSSGSRASRSTCSTRRAAARRCNR